MAATPADIRPLLFEVAWEVARKIGGIYTVLSSKAPCTVADWGDRYCLIGPYDKSADREFEPLEPGAILAEVLESLLRNTGMRVLFGRWLIPGHPRVLLIDLSTQWYKLDAMKAELYSTVSLASPEGNSDPETNEVVLFGFCVHALLSAFTRGNPGRTIITHVHEWMSGVCIPLLRRDNVPVATVFTTHATLLGRYLCAGQTDFYANLRNLNVDAEAANRGIFHRHRIEREAATRCHVFTTVSAITGLESQYILSRKPDVILPNGLQVERFTAPHKFQSLHQESKEKICEFLRGHFLGYPIDFDKTLIFFTAGRYEYFNKGYDMFIEALARLNGRLREEGSDVTVVAFIVTKANTVSYNVESLKAQSLIRETRKLCAKINDDMSARLFDSLINGRLIDPRELVTEQETVLLKQRLLSLQRDTLPPIVTHTMVDDAGDPVLKQLRRCQLFNRPEDNVKVIFHPAFLSATSAILSMDYSEFVRGTNLGVFPSFYEPWGYTPAECTVMGVPSVSSNLAGFANYVEEHVANPAAKGLFIVDRQFKSPEESMQQLVQVLFDFCHLTRRQRIMMRNETEKLSEVFDWSSLSRHYEEARGEALQRFFKDQAGAAGGGAAASPAGGAATAAAAGASS